MNVTPTRVGGCLLVLAVAFVASVTPCHVLQAQSPQSRATTPIRLVGIIPVPGNPLVTSDIIWVDQATRRLYVADRSNFGIDIFDAVKNSFVARITGFAGPEL